MGSKGSLPCSHQPTNCPYPQLDRFSPCPLQQCFLEMPFIIPQSRPRSSNWSLSLKFPHQNSICPPPSLHHATRLAHLTFLDLTTQTPLCEEHKSWNPWLCDLLQSHYFIPLIPTYLPQCHILRHPRTMFLALCERPSSTPTQNNKVLTLF